MVTEIYFAGAHSNVGVFATVADAAMHGFFMTMVDDCVLYRSRTRHDVAVKEMEADLGLESMKTADLLKKFGKTSEGKDGKEKKAEEGEGEEVAGTGRIRNPTLDPEVVEALVEKLRVGSTTEEDEDEAGSRRNSNSIPATAQTPTSPNGASARTAVNGGSKAPRRESLSTAEQLVGSGRPSERPKSAPVSGFQLPPEAASASNSPMASPERVKPERTPVTQRPFSMDASNLEGEEEVAVQEFKRTRMSASSVSSATTPSVPGAPRERVRAKVSMRRPQDRKSQSGIVHAPDKLAASSAAVGKSTDLARAMGGLSLSTISSGEAEKSQAAKDELLKSIMGKKTEAAPEAASATTNPTSSAAAEKPVETETIGEKKTNHSALAKESSTSTTSPPLATPQLPKDKPAMSTDEAKKESPSVGASTDAPKDTTTNATDKPSVDTNPTTETHSSRKHRRKDAAASKLCGPSDTLGEPDDTTSLITSFLPDDLAATAFATLKSEVQWRVMHHRGGEVPRLVAVQGTVAPDGSFPVYRHPADESPPLLPFSKTVDAIRGHVEQALKHPINHVLIQLYRAGTDFISEHSDKTLDIVKGSSIVNVSLGAQRVMTLRTKKKEREDNIVGGHTLPTPPSEAEDVKGKEPEKQKDIASPTPTQTSKDTKTPKEATPTEKAREPVKATKAAETDKEPVKPAETTSALKPPQQSPPPTKKDRDTEDEEKRIIQKIPLPHNSMFVLGLPTNQRWMHSINADRRPPREKTPAELAYAGERISLTFRHIGTFLTADESRIWGQGAVAKTASTARETIVGDEALAEEMVFAFAAENRMADGFDWERWYGKGFDVLHFKRRRRKIRLVSGDPGGLAVRIAAEVAGWGDVLVEEVRVGQQIPGPDDALPALEDVDVEKTVVAGMEAALMFLATATDEGRKWLLPDVVTKRADYARCISALMDVRRLRSAMEMLAAVSGGVLVEHPLFAKVHEELAVWEAWYTPRKDSDEDSGSRATVVDCAVFPYVKRLKELGFLDVAEKDGKGLRYASLARFAKRMEKEKFVKLAIKGMTATE
ncbi:hypothetical protein TWF696_000248 [Orbilia brochopaga]|uniref:Fe2OG dioxygenase domain-containing protein n=1 Tax=Orbilia brochopaga TaxID=3140254 RepID=A0AAV9VH43_9PEZI